jgi:hypothetical protein
MKTRGSRELRQVDDTHLEGATGGFHPAVFVGGAILMAGLGLWGVQREKSKCVARGLKPEVRSFGGGVYVSCKE